MVDYKEVYREWLENPYISDEDNSILKSDSYKLCVFQADSSGSRVSSPSYNLNLHPFITERTISADLTLSYNTEDDVYQLESLLGTKNLYISDNDKQYIRVYAAFTAEEGAFTNVYISKLIYLGYIDTQTT